MASAYSILANYGEYIQPYNLDLMQKGLEYKQQKFDANSALIQSKIDQFASLQLAKAEDKDYLNEKLTGLVNEVNSIGGMDVSSNGVTRNINNHIGQILDETVMNGYLGTKNLQNYQKEVAYYKKEKPEGYSQINEMYGMRSAIAWLNDGQAGTEYKGATYSPYIDVDAKLQSTISEMRKNASEQVVQLPTNDGRMVKRKVKELTADEIRSVASQMISTEDKQQMAINGWFNYGRTDLNTTKKVFTDYAENRLSTIDGRIAALNIKKKSGLTTEEREAVNGRIAFLTNERNNFDTRTKNVGNSQESIGMFLEEEKMMGALIDRNKFKEESIEYSNDQAFWNREQMNYNMVKDQRDFNYKVAKDDQTYQLELEKLGFQKTKFALENGIDPNSGVSSVGSGATPFSRETPNKDKESADQAIFESIEKNELASSNTIKEFYKGLSGKDKTEFDLTYEAAKNDPINKGKTETQIKRDVLISISNNGQNTSFVPTEVYDNLVTQRNEIRKNQTIFSDATKEVSQAIEASMDSIVEELGVGDGSNNYKNIPIVVNDSSGNTVKTSMKSYLEAKGILSTEDLKKNTKVYNEVMGQLYADKLISSYFHPTGATPERMTDPYSITIKKTANSNPDRHKSAKATYVKAIGERVGEDVTYDDIFEISTLQGGLLQQISIRESSNVAPKTLKLIRDIIEKEAYDTGDWTTEIFTRSNSIEDLGSLNNKLDPKSYDELYQEAIKKGVGKLPQNQGVAIAPATTLFTEAKTLVESAEVGRFEVKPKTTMRIYPDSELDGMVVIEQVQKSGSSQEDGISEVTKTARVPMRDLKGTSILKEIEFGSKQSVITAENMQPMQKTQISFADSSNLDYLDYIKESVLSPVVNGRMNESLDYVTKKDASNTLNSKYATMFVDEEGNKTDMKVIADLFLETSNRFKLKAQPNKNKTNIQMGVYYEDANGDEQALKVDNLNTTNFDPFQKTFDTAPQVFLYKTLDIILEEARLTYLQTGDYNTEEILKLKELYNTNK